MIRRIGSRAKALLRSRSFNEFADNVTPFTIEFIAAIALFIYMIQPILYLPEGFAGRITMMVYASYDINVDAVMPLILILWAVVVALSIIRGIRLHITPLQYLRENPVYILFICFIIWMLISVTVNGFTDITLSGDSYRGEGILTYICYIAVFFFLGSMITDERIKRVLCETSLISSIGVAIYAYYRYYYQQSATDHLEDFPTAFFNQFNHYGYFLAMNTMLAAGMFVMAKSLKSAIWYLAVLSVNTWMLNLNNTFGAWLACACGFVFMLIARAVMTGRFSARPLLPAAVFMVITIIMSCLGNGQLVSLIQVSTEMNTIASDGGTTAASGTTGARWLLWKNIVRFIKARPIFGYGVEGTGDMLSAVADNDRCHCEYMQYAADFGIPAAIFYTLACIGVFIRNVRNKKELAAISFACLTAAFTYMVSAVVGNSMSNTAPFFFIFLGLGYRSVRSAYRAA